MSDPIQMSQLRNISLLNGMTDLEIMQIEDKTILKTAHKGDYIYIPEDSSKYIYFLIRGYVNLGT